MPSLALRIASDHPAFAGHFPGRPIVPGVLLLDTAVLALESAAGVVTQGLAAAKFLSPALPGEALTLDYELDGAALRFEIRCDTRKVVSGRFDVAPLASP